MFAEREDACACLEGQRPQESARESQFHSQVLVLVWFCPASKGKKLSPHSGYEGSGGRGVFQCSLLITLSFPDGEVERGA